MKTSLLIFSFLTAGIIAGFFNLIPSDAADFLSMPVLYLLLFLVGVSLGADKEFVAKMRSQQPQMLLLAFFTVFGTLAGTCLISFFLPHRTLQQCMAVGSGFGYYSLSSILITEYMGAEIGVIALISNIIRELSVVAAAPLMIRFFGPLSPISVAGATSMDSNLPIITKYCGNDLIVISIIHGFMVDTSVPFLVSYFCSLQ